MTSHSSRVLGIIPARGGSKRLPRKNLALMGGKPLICHSVEAGLAARCIDEVVVSTDDAEIARVASGCGAEVPFLRPAELAQDQTSTFAVLRHAIEYLVKEQRKSFDYVVLLQPTSPLREASDIDRAMAFLHEKKADAVVSVCECDHSPLWSNTLPPDLFMGSFLKDEVMGKRSQELEQYYRLNGAIYICKTERLLAEGTFFLRDKVYAFPMPREKSVDIDTELDLAFCEFLMDWRERERKGGDGS